MHGTVSGHVAPVAFGGDWVNFRLENIVQWVQKF